MIADPEHDIILKQKHLAEMPIICTVSWLSSYNVPILTIVWRRGCILKVENKCDSNSRLMVDEITILEGSRQLLHWYKAT